jgi:Zn-dependent protease with chaperone function
MINWLQSAWKGQKKALPTFLLLVALPWIVATIVGSKLGLAKLFAFGYKLHPAISIPLGVFEFSFMFIGLICYWRSAFNCSQQWYGYVGRTVVGIRMFELLSRLLLAVVLLYMLFSRK